MENNSDITNNFSEQNNDNLAINLHFSTNNRKPNSNFNYDHSTTIRQNHYNHQTFFRGNRNNFYDSNSSRIKNETTFYDYSNNGINNDYKHNRNLNSGFRGGYKTQKNYYHHSNDHRNSYTDGYNNNRHQINFFSNKNKSYDRKEEVDMNKIYRSALFSSERNSNPNISNKDKSVVRKRLDLNKIELDGMNQRDSLIWQLNHSKYECMICVANIRAETQTWSCDNCYHIFHIHCIKKWAMTCGGAGNTDERNGDDDKMMNLRCPACQKEYNMNVNKTVDESKGKEWIDYRCFCGKQVNPTFKKRSNVTPHSCDDACGKPNRNNDKCPHLCVLMCHPGPCPPCEAIVTRNCQCEQTKITTKCNADERSMVCGEKCGKYLNCRVHRCEQSCHACECNECEVEIEQKCWCDRKSVRTVICGGVETQDRDPNLGYSCDNQCSRTLECGNHQCEQMCHSGDCGSCSLTVDRINRCWCKKMSIDELDASCQRESCLDPIPSCGEVCEKIIDSCGHVCSRICHEGECGPCPLTRDVVCRCGKTTHIGLACSSLEGARNNNQDGDDDDESCDGDIRITTNRFVLCNKVCNKKMSCGRHRCNEKCCVSELHICLRPCARTLSCKSHQCERECGHMGLCPSCPNVSFDELHCECGAATLLPPVACGQSPPICNRICSRDHDCSHPVRHNCHSKESCPPCTDLVSKPCPGTHKIMDNIPCFRSVVTCGLPCGRPLSNCKHVCTQICHIGECSSGSTGNNDEKCSQSCGNVLVCGHSCSIPCHGDSECNSFNIDCSVPVSVQCKCGLRSSEFNCSPLRDYQSKSQEQLLLLSNDLFLCEGESGGNLLYLSCNDICKNAQFLSNRTQTVLTILQSVNNSSLLLQRYYSAYLEDFSRNNFNFVVSVEKIFQTLSQQQLSSYRFSVISVDKAKFISRFSTCYKLISKVAYNFEMNTANVIVEFVVNKTNIPKILLSKTVEDKYFKIFKPSF